MNTDRRAHPRHEITIAIQFRGDGTQATTRDLSRGGCAILAPRMRLVNERLALALTHPSTGETLEVAADVKRAIAMPDGKWLLGVQFVSPDEALQVRIGAMVDALAARRAAQVQATPVDEASRLASDAADAENGGNRNEAMKLLDRAILAAPQRADILVTRARLASETGDATGAANFAKRAAELEPTNSTYAQLYQRFTAHDVVPPAAASGPRPAATPAPVPKKSFLPRDGRSFALAIVAGLAVLGITGGNVWYWVLREPPGSPVRLDTSTYQDLVPLRTLAIRGGRAFGTVDSTWSSLPDREKRVADLAVRLRGQQVSAVFLSDPEARLVASHKDGTTRLFR